MEFTRDEILESAYEKITEIKRNQGVESIPPSEEYKLIGYLHAILDRAQLNKKLKPLADKFKK